LPNNDRSFRSVHPISVPNGWSDVLVKPFRPGFCLKANLRQKCALILTKFRLGGAAICSRFSDTGVSPNSLIDGIKNRKNFAGSNDTECQSNSNYC
jgi:hypothetical protein